jgi:hypothetical protein
MCNLILIAGIITFITVGFTSSSLIFTAFAFLPQLLMNYRFDEEQLDLENLPVYDDDSVSHINMQEWKLYNRLHRKTN